MACREKCHRGASQVTPQPANAFPLPCRILGGGTGVSAAAAWLLPPSHTPVPFQAVNRGGAAGDGGGGAPG